MRRALKWLALGLIVLLLLSAAGYLFVRSAYMQGLIKAEVIARVEKGLNARLTIARVSGNPLYGLSFHGVRLSLPEGEEVLSAKRVRVSYLLPQLLLSGGDYTVNLRLDAPRLQAVRERDGRFNLQRLLKPTVGPRRQVRLRSLSLAGGEVRLTLHPKGEAGGRPREYLFSELAVQGNANIVTGPASELDLRLGRASFALTQPRRLTVARLSGRLQVAPKRVLLADLLAATSGSQVRLSLETRDWGRTFSLAARANPLELAEFQGLIPALPPRGRLLASATLAGKREAARLEVKLNLGKAGLQGSGTLNLTDLARPGYDLAARLRGLDPALVSNAAAKLSGELNADLEAAGEGVSAATAEATLSLKLLPSRLGKYEVKEAQATGTLSGGTLTIKEADVLLPFGRLAFGGEVANVSGLRAGELSARLSGRLAGLDVAALSGRKGLTSDINAGFEATLSRGPKRPLSAAASLELAASSIAGSRIEAGSLALSLREGALEVSRLRLITPLLNLSGRGTFSDSRLEGAFEAAAADIGPLARALKPQTREASGSLSLTGRLSGTLKSIDAEAQLSGSSLRYGAVSAKGLSGTLSVSGLRNSPRGTFLLTASKMAAGRQEVETLRAEGTVRGSLVDFKLQAAADRERTLSLSGTATDLTATTAELTLAELRLTTPRLSLSNVRPLRASLSAKGAVVRDIDLATEGNTLRLSGTLGTYTPLDLGLELDALPLAPWLPQGVPLQGRASGQVRLTGTPAEPRMAGQLRLAGAVVEGPQVEGAGKRRYLFERAEAGLSYAAGRLNLSADLLYEGNAVTAAGSVPVRLSLWPARMELARIGLNLTLISENAELAPLAAAFIPKAEVSGRFSATVAATGNPRQPDLEGRATVQDAAVRAPGLPQELRNIQGQVAFNRDRLVIEHMSADTEGGRAQLRGRVGLRAPMPLDLVVEARRFRVSLPEQSGWARVNADLTLTGTRLAPTVEGTIDVEEARVSIPERLTPSLREIRVVETLEDLKRPERRPEGVVRGLERNVAVDVLVLAERRVWVRGRGLEAEFALNLEAVKEREGSLRIVGTADVIRGNYSLRGKRLAIERGQALFRGLPSPDPDVSARLTYEVQRTTIVVLLSGTLSKPEIQITSEPPMDPTNVYSYLFFGRSADKLGRGEGTVLQQQVASLLGGAAAQELTGVLGQELALDTFELTPAEGELGIEAVSLGKYLTRDLFVTFERSFGLEAENRVRIDYRLSKWFSLESQFGSERTTGFDLFWNYDFSYLTK